MTLILKSPLAESAQPTTVEDSLRAFAEAVRGAESPYSVQDLVEMVAAEIRRKPESALTEATFNEAGGVISWIKRYVTGADEDIIEEIRSEMSSIKTRQEKDAMLRFIDKLIAEVRKYTDRGDVNSGVRGGIAGFFTLGYLRSVFASVTKGKEMRKNAEALAQQLAQQYGEDDFVAQGAKRAANQVGKLGTITHAIGLFALVRLVANIFHIIRKNNGSAMEYLDALSAVRSEVAAIQV